MATAPDSPLVPSSPVPPPPAHVEFKALLLLILMAALICGFVLYVMYARGVFESTQSLVLIADDSEGVLVGMDLTFSGFPIGRVQRIDLGSDGKARILIDVPRKDANWLRTTSVFTLERGLVGDTRIRAFSGVLDDPLLPPDSERAVLRGDTAAEIPRLVATARELLENLQTITAADSSLNTSLANMQTMTGRLTGQYGVLGGALGSDENAKKIIATLDRVNALLVKADQRVFGQPGQRGVMDDAQAAIVQLNGVLSDARNSLKKVDAVLAEAQAVGSNVRIASNDLGALRAEVDASLRKVTQLVDEINRKWPFARNTELKLP
ncbi:phospholipid/cholesterol/gamma-HCH transport system substrate-binding protein [Collimonas sp. OK242]|jgi:phospholipid/cholesterol/gamma-HCH transport system substrate-binding protein|uniref:MlaD family protein n=1 Tax=Collimonas sp. OK242 TaxID=1798195 RepID=UPI000895B5AF|nr:MlaD family protein [Collimonas sp. OK242]SDX28392.1 phospholipid/cholesterol/gamma-HCH transport system substrate-binding protein [Collimonas sp. OK242]